MEALLLEQNKVVHEHSRYLFNLAVETFCNAETIFEVTIVLSSLKNNYNADAASESYVPVF